MSVLCMPTVIQRLCGSVMGAYFATGGCVVLAFIVHLLQARALSPRPVSPPCRPVSALSVSALGDAAGAVDAARISALCAGAHPALFGVSRYLYPETS
jgi:hypothetical protein